MSVDMLVKVSCVCLVEVCLEVDEIGAVFESSVVANNGESVPAVLVDERSRGMVMSTE